MIETFTTEMAKRKTSIVIEDVLPDDDRLGQRGKLWKSFMEKYAKKKEDKEMVFDSVCNMLDYEPSDHSDASDVETDAQCEEDDFPLENREELDKQLERVVAVRKRNWAQNGLLKLMESIEDPGHNMLSHEKVEKWLFGQRGPFDVTQANETVMTERNADGDRMKYHRKQQVTVSRSVDDADSLYSVDTAKYILQNKRDRSTTSKIKVTTMIKKYTISTNNSNALAIRPNLHSISGFPIISEEPSSSLLHKTSKSDSAFETGEDQTQNRSNERSTISQPSKIVKPPVIAATQPEKPNKRKKVFKKTVKKSSLKSPSSRKSTAAGSQKYEEALKSCVHVKKLPNQKARRIHWQETSHVAQSSSSDESDEVFTRTTRSKTNSSKRGLQTRSRTSKTPETTPPRSPRKKALLPSPKTIGSPRKTVDRDLVLPFEAICLSPTKKFTKHQTAASQQMNKTVDQTSNLTALFSGANEKITNSTEIINTTANSSRSVRSGYSGNRTLSGMPDASRSIVVYEPKKIQPNIGANEAVRITYSDLTLDQVTKARHLEKFKKFNYLIHPNSTVRFFPSDSEEDGPAPTIATTTTTFPSDDDDGDESFDEDDPILTFNPREASRLNVLEYPYNRTHF